MIEKRITTKNIPRIYYPITIFALIILAGLIGCVPPLAPTGHMQSNPQDNLLRRISQLEELVAKQQEVIEAMQSELQKFKEKEGGNRLAPP